VDDEPAVEEHAIIQRKPYGPEPITRLLPLSTINKYPSASRITA